MSKRTLVLRTDRLIELTTAELAGVAGGAQTQDCPDFTYYCVTGDAICAGTRIICT